MKVGEKYIIEISDVVNGNLAKIKGFNTLVFDENGLNKLEPYEKEEELREPQIGDVYRDKTSGTNIIVTYDDMGVYTVLFSDGDDNYYNAEELNKGYEFVENRVDLLEPIKIALSKKG